MSPNETLSGNTIISKLAENGGIWLKQGQRNNRINKSVALRLNTTEGRQ